MGNCNACIRPSEKSDAPASKPQTPKHRKKPHERYPNPYAQSPTPIRVLKDFIPRTRISDKYILGRELGRGEFGVTYLCTDRETREALACKSISKKKLRTAVDVEDVRREVAIMASLPDHPNVVKLRATYEDNEAVHLVMELCEGGELFDRIVARGHYSERAAAAVAKTVAEVVRMCHHNGVMHRDLKPENFLFANKKENSALKAIDFGLSVFFKPGERFSEIVGSPYYMAPEVLKRNYGPEVDIWSAGVILYILLCGVPPFWAETEQGVALAILRGAIDFKREPWPQVSDSAKGLVRQMLEPDPKRRLTAQQVLDHPWIQNAKKASNVPLGDIVRARLKQFSVMNRFKKKALRVIAEHLSVEEVEVIRDMFALMDTDNDGKVTYEELKDGLRKVGSQLAEPEIKLLMDVADVDGNGVLDYGEFVAVTIHLQRMENDEHIRTNIYTNGTTHMQQPMHVAVNVPTGGPENMLLGQGPNVGLMQGLNGGPVKAECGYTSDHPPLIFGAENSLLDPHNAIGDASSSFNGGESSSQALNEILDNETSSFGILGQMPRNFSLSDLTADFSNNNDILSYSRSPFLGTGANFLDPHIGGGQQDMRRRDSVSDAFSYDDFASD